MPEAIPPRAGRSLRRLRRLAMTPRLAAAPNDPLDSLWGRFPLTG
ncbi:MAG: hypothetical protein ACPLYD_09990 [Anaerolineae bacterium]